MARIIWVSRVTYLQTENGLRSPRNDELQKVAENFELSLSDIQEQNSPKATIEIPSRENDPNYKFKHTLLYILSRCGQKPNIGKTILNKLLYFADFNFYEKNGENSITNAVYVKMPFWPVPSVMNWVIAEMLADEQITAFDSVYQWYPQQRYMPLVSADISGFSALEIQELDTVIDQFSDKTASWISNHSHEDVPYKATEWIGTPISYGLTFYRTPEYSVRPPEVYED